MVITEWHIQREVGRWVYAETMMQAIVVFGCQDTL